MPQPSTPPLLCNSGNDEQSDAAVLRLWNATVAAASPQPPRPNPVVVERASGVLTLRAGGVC